MQKQDKDKDNLPKTMHCHCCCLADKYRTRMFINQLGYTVYRVFYRCRNCWSRVNRDFSPEFDRKNPPINVMDTLKELRKKKQ